jgi:hypothetical protein
MSPPVRHLGVVRAMAQEARQAELFSGDVQECSKFLDCVLAERRGRETLVAAVMGILSAPAREHGAQKSRRPVDRYLGLRGPRAALRIAHGQRACGPFVKYAHNSDAVARQRQRSLHLDAHNVPRLATVSSLGNFNLHTGCLILIILMP